MAAETIDGAVVNTRTPGWGGAAPRGSDPHRSLLVLLITVMLLAIVVLAMIFHVVSTVDDPVTLTVFFVSNIGSLAFGVIAATLIMLLMESRAAQNAKEEKRDVTNALVEVSHAVKENSGMVHALAGMILHQAAQAGSESRSGATLNQLQFGGHARHANEKLIES